MHSPLPENTVTETIVPQVIAKGHYIQELEKAEE
jgi:hypothetical protein